MGVEANIALTNLVYSMCRIVQIKKYQPNLIVIHYDKYLLSNEKIVVSLHP